jgi:hypothetical protein
MHTDRQLNLCLKLFAQTGSDQGDGTLAALKLRERMEPQGIDFEALLDYVCQHGADYAYQAENFFALMERAQAIWKSAATPANDKLFAPFPLTAVEISGATLHTADVGLNDTTSSESGAPCIPVREHTRTSRKGKVFTVRSHSRRCRARGTKRDLRKDPSVKPGNDYEWIEGHERWYCHAGQGRKIRVRGYWRKKSSIALKKAA